jgi:hypothetical protein
MNSVLLISRLFLYLTDTCHGQESVLNSGTYYMNTFNVACEWRCLCHLQPTAHIVTRRQTYLPSPFEVGYLFHVQVTVDLNQVMA